MSHMVDLEEETTSSVQAKVWKMHARQWSHVSSPLRPIEEDQELILQSASTCLTGPSALVAILGVTPELVQIDWPASVRLVAVDHSADMIAQVWRPSSSVASSVNQADWRQLPFVDHALSLAIGDGVLTVLPSLAQYSEVFTELKRALRPGGRLILRCFVKPPNNEPVWRIAEDALLGRIKSFHAFKWRLAMSLCRAPDFSVPVRRIHTVFSETFQDRAVLASASGWSLQAINTIDAYRDAHTVYTFPSLEVIRKISGANFKFEGARYGSYELADRCPILVLDR